MTKTILDVQNLASGYGKLPIIENINTHVEDEQIVVIVGPNGAGKSTLLKSVFGLNRRIAGEISFHGQSIFAAKPRNWSQWAFQRSRKVTTYFRP